MYSEHGQAHTLYGRLHGHSLGAQLPRISASTTVPEFSPCPSSSAHLTRSSSFFISADGLTAGEAIGLPTDHLLAVVALAATFVTFLASGRCQACHSVDSTNSTTITVMQA